MRGFGGAVMAGRVGHSPWTSAIGRYKGGGKGCIGRGRDCGSKDGGRVRAVAAQPGWQGPSLPWNTGLREGRCLDARDDALGFAGELKERLGPEAKASGDQVGRELLAEPVELAHVAVEETTSG